MSTGDQSEYMRGKMAERGTSEGVQFSRDGFDRWAESTAPARAGQMEKEPAETQMVRTGGAMSVAQAKRLAQKYARKAVDMVVKHKGKLRGGRSVNIAGINIEIPEIVDKALDYGEKILNFALLLEQKLPEIKQAIQEEIIDNNDDPSITATDRQAAKAMLPILDEIKSYLTMLKNIKGYADVITNALKGSGRCGGAAKPTLVQRFQAAVKYIGEKAQQLLGYVSFFTRNAPFLKQMLKLRPLRPYGQQILDKINPILAIVGLGKGGRKPTCDCSDSEEYRGGFGFPGFGEQKQVATMQSGYKGEPMDDGGMQMGMMGDYNMGGPMKYESTYEPPPLTQEPMEHPDRKILMKQLEDLKRQLRESDSDEERERLKKRYVSTEKKLKEMMRGGFSFPGFGQQKQESTMMPMQGSYGMMGGPVSQGMQSGYKGSPMRDDGGMQMDNYDMSTGKYESTVAAREVMDSSSSAAEIKGLKQKLNKLKSDKNPSADKQELIMELESRLQELTMRGGASESAVIKRIKAEISRLKNMSSNGEYSTATKRKIQELEGYLKEMMRGGKTTFQPSTTSSKPSKPLEFRGGVVYNPREPTDTAVTSRAVGGRKPSARGAIVKKVMRERGLSLPQASRYVKENGLY